MAFPKSNGYWDILLQGRIINQMETKKFQKKTLKSKCKAIKDIIHQIECSKQQINLTKQTTTIEHAN